MIWQSIETFPPDLSRSNNILLWGRGYGDGDTPQEIAEEAPRLWLMAYAYQEGERTRFASTENYYGTETYYVDASCWCQVDPPSSRIVD